MGVILSLLLTGCTDFYNRTYYYGEEAPVDPFSVRLTKTDYQIQGEIVVLKTWIDVMNKSGRTAAFNPNTFQLRVGDSKRVSQLNQWNPIDFNASEDSTIPIVFTLSKKDAEN